MSVNTPIIKEIADENRAMLKMIEDSIVKCKDELWQDFSHELVISQLVYHVLFNADVFLSKTNVERQSVKGKYGPSDPTGFFHNPNMKFTKQQLLEYLGEIRDKADKLFTSLTIEDLTKEIFYDYNDLNNTLLGNLLFSQRHIMEHIGGLHARLTLLGNNPLPWINKVYGDERDTWEEMNTQGIDFILEGKLDEAEKIFLELCTKAEKPGYFYNLACIKSRKGEKEKALDNLKKCFKVDEHKLFKNLAETDSDFNNIHDLPAFQQLILT